MHINTKYGLVDLAVRPLLGMRIMIVTRGALIKNASGQTHLIKEGSVLMLRGKMYSIYETIEDALSALMQAVETYGDDQRGERAAVMAWRKELKRLIADLLDFDRLYAKGAAESVLMGFGDKLAGTSAAPKKAAKKFITAAASLTDSLGRRNPWRQMMMLSQADRKLEKRIIEAMRIKGRMVERLVALSKHYRNSVMVVRTVKETLGAILGLDQWQRIDLAFGQGSGMLKAEERLQAIATCKLLIDLVNSLDVAPFIVYRYLTLGDLNSALGALVADRLTTAKTFLLRAFSGSRLELAHVRLERIRSEIGLIAKRGEKVDVEKFVARLLKFLDNLSEVNDQGLTAACVELVRASVEAAIPELQAGVLTSVDGYLDRAIRLL